MERLFIILAALLLITDVVKSNAGFSATSMCMPFKDARGLGYVLTERASYAGLLNGKCWLTTVVEGTHNRPYFTPRFECR